ncbi:MAG: hypothetical protein SFY68_04875 [Candidatus Sumerlaeia bacterium]|nr:hypothetical protein [Candidatus Sumerlaeia bacterium]
MLGKIFLAWIVAGFTALLLYIGYGFSQASITKEGGEILRLVWGQVTFLDLYLGLILASIWAVYRERFRLMGWVWILVFLFTGFLGVYLYVGIQVWKFQKHRSLPLFFWGQREVS